MFDSILEAESLLSLPTVAAVFLCMFVAFICGIAVAFAYRVKNEFYTKNMFSTLIILPIVVQAVILLVGRTDANAVLGTGIAIGGTFALVRFRSVPGNSKDIASVFSAMVFGIAAGMGYIWFALVLTAVVCGLIVALKFIPLDKIRAQYACELRITVPDDLDYESQLSGILNTYAKTFQIVRIKTSRMGSLLEIRYKIRLRAANTEKKLIDDLRVKNGNLPVVIKRFTESNAEL